MQNMPILHIVDDNESVRKSLHMLMESENIHAKSYASAEDFLERHDKSSFGCLLLDVRMPGMNGLELIDLLKSENIQIPVVFITGHGDINMAVEAMKKGALDFIEKPFDPKNLLRSVTRCLNRAVDVNHKQSTIQETEAKIATLTCRERQVMNLLVDGKQNKIIADELDISSRTVELHRSKVMSKLEASSLSDVVRYALLVSGVH